MPADQTCITYNFANHRLATRDHIKRVYNISSIIFKEAKDSPSKQQEVNTKMSQHKLPLSLEFQTIVRRQSGGQGSPRA